MNDSKKEAAKKPNPHDVHEQREKNQVREGVVRKPSPSLADDLQRSEGEGMGTMKPVSPQPIDPAPPSRH